MIGRNGRGAAAGVVLPTMLLFALAVAMLAAAALHGSAMEIRGAAWHREAAQARNVAETALDLLLRRAAERWVQGDGQCALDHYCAADFPALAAFLEEAPPQWSLSVALATRSKLPLPPLGTVEVSSRHAYRWLHLEAQVLLEGPSPVALAAGLALPYAARGSMPP